MNRNPIHWNCIQHRCICSHLPDCAARSMFYLPTSCILHHYIIVQTCHLLIAAISVGETHRGVAHWGFCADWNCTAWQFRIVPVLYPVFCNQFSHPIGGISGLPPKNLQSSYQFVYSNFQHKIFTHWFPIQTRCEHCLHGHYAVHSKCTMSYITSPDTLKFRVLRCGHCLNRHYTFSFNVQCPA